MDNTTVLLILLFVLILGGISLFCQIYAARKLVAAGVEGRGRGRYGWVLTFVRGWQNAASLEITDIMLFWTVIVVLTVAVLAGLCAYEGFLSTPQ
jgi:hypothetical protein